MPIEHRCSSIRMLSRVEIEDEHVPSLSALPVVESSLVSLLM